MCVVTKGDPYLQRDNVVWFEMSVFIALTEQIVVRNLLNV